MKPFNNAKHRHTISLKFRDIFSTKPWSETLYLFYQGTFSWFYKARKSTFMLSQVSEFCHNFTCFNIEDCLTKNVIEIINFTIWPLAFQNGLLVALVSPYLLKLPWQYCYGIKVNYNCSSYFQVYINNLLYTFWKNRKWLY